MRDGDGQQPPLRFAADEDRPVVAERHDRRHERIAGAVANDSRLSVAHVGDQTVGRAEIDADDFTHALGLGLGFGFGGSSPEPKFKPRLATSRSMVASRLLM